MKKTLFFCLGSALMVQNSFSDLNEDLKNTSPNNSNWSSFKNKSFTNLTLSQKVLTGIDLSGCTFNNCTMTDVKLINSDLTRSVFNGGSLTRVTIEGAHLNDVQFSDTTTLSFLHLYDGDPGIVPYFPKTKDDQDYIVAFIGQQKDFIQKSIDKKTTDVTLKSNFLKAAISIGALIPCMKFDLSNYNFNKNNKKDLNNYNFSGCNLSGCILSDCDLAGANLSGCNISGIDFSHADLSKASLEGVFIKDGKNPILKNIKVGDKGPRLPDKDISIEDLKGVRREGSSGSSTNSYNYTYDNDAREIMKNLLLAMGVPQKYFSAITGPPK